MKKPKEAIEKLEMCLVHDACDMTDCEYFPTHDEIRDILAWIHEQEETIFRIDGDNADLIARIQHLEGGIREMKKILEME